MFGLFGKKPKLVRSEEEKRAAEQKGAVRADGSHGA